jgi:hypothetical protein
MATGMGVDLCLPVMRSAMEKKVISPMCSKYYSNHYHVAGRVAILH